MCDIMSIVCKYLSKNFLCAKRLSMAHNPFDSEEENKLGRYLPCFFANCNDKESMKEFCKYYEERVSTVPFWMDDE